MSIPNPAVYVGDQPSFSTRSPASTSGFCRFSVVVSLSQATPIPP